MKTFVTATDRMCSSRFSDLVFHASQVNIVFQWLLATLRPFLEILDGWLTAGELKDPYSEFFIKG